MTRSTGHDHEARKVPRGGEHGIELCFNGALHGWAGVDGEWYAWDCDRCARRAREGGFATLTAAVEGFHRHEQEAHP